MAQRAGRYDHLMPPPWYSATLFLTRLRAQAYAAGRMHLVETTPLAFLFGALSGTHLTSWEELVLPATWSAALTPAVLIGALWLGGGYALYYYARESHRNYLEWLLVEAGLLYLVLEHEPHEALPALSRRSALRKLAGLEGGGLSFRARINHLLATYAACARRLGHAPYSSPWREVEYAVAWASVPASALFAWLVYRGVLLALEGEVAFPAVYKWSFALLILLIFVRATLQVARSTALRLALANVLIGEAQPGQATLARHP